MEGIGQATATAYQAYRYNGKELEEATGLYDYGARYYDPAIARWGQVDALADHPNQVDKSPYAYAWNNPIKLTDPDGNCPQCGAVRVGWWILKRVVTEGFKRSRPGSGAPPRVDPPKTINEGIPIPIKGIVAENTSVSSADILLDRPEGLQVLNTEDGNEISDTQSETRREALNKAKEANGIPRSASPD